MSQLVPHLLLRTDQAVSYTAEILSSGGYMVSKIEDDGIFETVADGSHVDGVILELPALRAIAVARRIELMHGAGNVVMVVVASPAETVGRALRTVPVVSPAEIRDNLISSIDLALVARELRRADYKSARCAAVATG